MTVAAIMSHISSARMLSHLCRVDSSILIHWTGTFPVEGVFGLFSLLQFFIEMPVFYANSGKQLRRRILRRLSCVHTICHCPFYLDAKHKWIKK